LIVPNNIPNKSLDKSYLITDIRPVHRYLKYLEEEKTLVRLISSVGLIYVALNVLPAKTSFGIIP